MAKMVVNTPYGNRSISPGKVSLVCGILAKKNKSLRQRAEEVVLQISVDYGSIFFARFGWKAAPSAGLAKVDFAKSCFQRT
jgi:hypothetical protein